jgi:hypothetical protein
MPPIAKNSPKWIGASAMEESSPFKLALFLVLVAAGAWMLWKTRQNGKDRDGNEP